MTVMQVISFIFGLAFFGLIGFIIFLIIRGIVKFFVAVFGDAGPNPPPGYRYNYYAGGYIPLGASRSNCRIYDSICDNSPCCPCMLYDGPAGECIRTSYH